MLGSDFLNALIEAMPSHAELEDYGLDPEEIDSVQACFKSVARESLEGISTGKSELEKMLLEYDCSTVEVGLIRFLPEPHEHCGGMQVAFCEADPIIVDTSGIVFMHDHADHGCVTECAADSERFLDALAAYVGFKREKSQWKGRAKEAADLCAVKAGGSEYAPFFRLLCGPFG